MKLKIIKSVLGLFIIYFAQAQVGIGTNYPAVSAKLEVYSTNQGFLPPRLTTTERNAITYPVPGLIIFNTTTNGLEIKTTSGWLSIRISSPPQDYPSIQIGTQVWMTENLDVSTYRDGTPIPEITDATTWAGLTTGAWCKYNNDASNGAVYGKLYNWYAIQDPKGLCPDGWHVPTDAEWSTLSSLLVNNVGGKLKATGTSLWNSSNINATNSSGFTGIPGGGRDHAGSFTSLGTYAYWWSASEYSTTNAWYRAAYYNTGILYNYHIAKADGLAVRCVKD